MGSHSPPLSEWWEVGAPPPCSWTKAIASVFCSGADATYALGHFIFLDLVNQPDVLIL